MNPVRRAVWIFAAAGASASALCLPIAVGASGAQPALARTKRLRFNFEMTNRSGSAIRQGAFELFGPIESAVHHRLVDVRANLPYSLRSDGEGNRALSFALGEFAPFQTRTLRIDFEVASVARRPPSPAPQHLVDAPFIEAKHPEVRRLADSLRRPTARASVSAVFDWLVRNVSYAGFVPEDRGALYAITEGNGDCTEYAYAAAALCRALGLPARVLGGYVVERDWVQPRADEYHNWAEVFVDGSWRLVDAQRAVLDAKEDSYLPLRVVAPERGVVFVHRFSGSEGLTIQQA